MAEYSAVPATLVLTNTFPTTTATEEVWNTGNASVGYPHADELNAEGGYVDTATRDVTADWAQTYEAAIRVFRSNQYIYLKPGDSLTIKVDIPEAVVYYEGLADKYLTVAVSGE